MNILRNPELREKLSAEYVLGTLKGGARRRFESLLSESAVLEQCVSEWQDRLYPLSEFAPSISPSLKVWDNIQATLNLQQQEQKKSPAKSFWNNLNFWRNVGLVSTTLATALLIFLVAKPSTEILHQPSYVAMLSNDKAQLTVVVTGNPQTQKLVVKVIANQTIPSDKSLELWAISKDGVPRALGLVAENGTITLPLPENISTKNFTLMAISLEPKGGSPNPNAPTGPILFKGNWAEV